jgi:GT2 family glycosyltransferase
VGILILNYRQPEATLDCARRLLAQEGPETRILWLEQDIDLTRETVLAMLRASGLPFVELDRDTGAMPEPGQVGLVGIRGDLGFGAGNNVGVRFLHRHRVPYAWVVSNDAVVAKGSSADLLRAAQARPEVGLWGMGIASGGGPVHRVWRIQERDFAGAEMQDAGLLATDPMAFVSGCAMFFPTDLAADLGGIPEDYFLYYEDAAFCWEMRRAGHGLGTVPEVEVQHAGSMTNGRRSAWTEYYCRRNRWLFIQRYFPERLGIQRFRFFAYQLQKLLFRLRFDRIRLEWQAYADFRKGETGPGTRMQ